MRETDRQTERTGRHDVVLKASWTDNAVVIILWPSCGQALRSGGQSGHPTGEVLAAGRLAPAGLWSFPDVTLVTGVTRRHGSGQPQRWKRSHK
ncbi:hypothetical protein ElyMa_001601800 [Elysia marginata]|uniref:Uncharacterized protein n=1 Tax=Elysia marginata TaxID=1093978 RepID=A0AAV4JHR7_9GAST|nr:hypothetical protein ElyMa_001601800 [Elysia marginata]